MLPCLDRILPHSQNYKTNVTQDQMSQKPALFDNHFQLSGSIPVKVFVRNSHWFNALPGEQDSHKHLENFET